MPMTVISHIIALSAWTESVKVLTIYEPVGKILSLLQMGFLGDCPVMYGDKHGDMKSISLSMKMPGAHSYRCFCVPLTLSRKHLIKSRLAKPTTSISKDNFMKKAHEIAIYSEDDKYNSYIKDIGHLQILESCGATSISPRRHKGSI
jgi:hypothetical protein